MSIADARAKLDQARALEEGPHQDALRQDAAAARQEAVVLAIDALIDKLDGASVYTADSVRCERCGVERPAG